MLLEVCERHAGFLVDGDGFGYVDLALDYRDDGAAKEGAVFH